MWGFYRGVGGGQGGIHGHSYTSGGQRVISIPAPPDILEIDRAVKGAGIDM